MWVVVDGCIGVGLYRHFLSVASIFFFSSEIEKLLAVSKNWGEGAGSLRGGGLKYTLGQLKSE